MRDKITYYSMVATVSVIFTALGVFVTLIASRLAS